MSRLNDPENFAGRVNYAAAALVRGFGPNGATRALDNCFESDDGRVVAAALARRAEKNERLRAAMSRHLSADYVASAVAEYGSARNLAAAAREARAKSRAYWAAYWAAREAKASNEEATAAAKAAVEELALC